MEYQGSGASSGSWRQPVSFSLPVAGYAQEAVVSGIVRDATAGVLPGVTVTAIHEATGNTFEAVTDDGGAYRIPRMETYRVTAAITGFATVTPRIGLELLLGQQAVVVTRLVDFRAAGIGHRHW